MDGARKEEKPDEQKEEDTEVQIPPQDQQSPVLCLLSDGGENLYLSMGGTLSGKVDSFRNSVPKKIIFLLRSK